jgi:hypothetical protein
VSKVENLSMSARLAVTNQLFKQIWSTGSQAAVFDSGRTVSSLACVNTNASVAKFGAISKSPSV